MQLEWILGVVYFMHELASAVSCCCLCYRAHNAHEEWTMRKAQLQAELSVTRSQLQPADCMLSEELSLSRVSLLHFGHPVSHAVRVLRSALRSRSAPPSWFRR